LQREINVTTLRYALIARDIPVLHACTPGMSEEVRTSFFGTGKTVKVLDCSYSAVMQQHFVAYLYRTETIFIHYFDANVIK